MAWAVGGYFMADLIILYYTHWLKANLDFKYENQFPYFKLFCENEKYWNRSLKMSPTTLKY